MTHDYLLQQYLRLSAEYANGLDYMRNNPYITKEEVQEHFKVIRDRHATLMALRKK